MEGGFLAGFQVVDESRYVMEILFYFMRQILNSLDTFDVFSILR